MKTYETCRTMSDLRQHHGHHGHRPLHVDARALCLRLALGSGSAAFCYIQTCSNTFKHATKVAKECKRSMLHRSASPVYAWWSTIFTVFSAWSPAPIVFIGAAGRVLPTGHTHCPHCPDCPNCSQAYQCILCVLRCPKMFEGMAMQCWSPACAKQKCQRACMSLRKSACGCWEFGLELTFANAKHRSQLIPHACLTCFTISATIRPTLQIQEPGASLGLLQTHLTIANAQSYVKMRQKCVKT